MSLILEMDHECAFCLEWLHEEAIMELPGCNHAFHTRCFLEYIKHNVDKMISCPKCRGVVMHLPQAQRSMVVHVIPREEDIQQEHVHTVVHSPEHMHFVLRMMFMLVFTWVLWVLATHIQ